MQGRVGGEVSQCQLDGPAVDFGGHVEALHGGQENGRMDDFALRGAQAQERLVEWHAAGFSSTMG